jgi:anti-sigma factor RsiW
MTDENTSHERAMSCQSARTAFAELELELLAPAERAVLDSHLGRCTACSEWVASERRLSAALAALRVEAPFEIDVTRRVAARISGPGSGREPEVSVREFGWSAALVALGSVGLLLGFWGIAPALPTFVEKLKLAGAAVGSTGSALLAPVVALITTGAKSLGHLLASIGAVAGTLESLQPVAIATVALCAVMMATSIALVVGRDLRRPRWLEEESTR